jgi:hypothetical protein
MIPSVLYAFCQFSFFDKNRIMLGQYPVAMEKNAPLTPIAIPGILLKAFAICIRPSKGNIFGPKHRKTDRLKYKNTIVNQKRRTEEFETLVHRNWVFPNVKNTTVHTNKANNAVLRMPILSTKNPPSNDKKHPVMVEQV